MAINVVLLPQMKIWKEPEFYLKQILVHFLLLMAVVTDQMIIKYARSQ